MKKSYKIEFNEENVKRSLHTDFLLSFFALDIYTLEKILYIVNVIIEIRKKYKN